MRGDSAQLPAATELTMLGSAFLLVATEVDAAMATGRRGKEPTLIPAFPRGVSLSRPTIHKGSRSLAA